jgi:pimeloyl-ACP methyl ester carboxylesterase
MPSTILGFLSKEWSGLAVAALVALAASLLLAASAATPPWLRGLAWAILAASALLALGALGHLLSIRRMRRAYPPPGRLVDVDGYRIHVMAEGAASGRPSIVWLPGGHTGAFALYHLHRSLRDEARSILVDRPGTGWSDAGPFPRTTEREAAEIPAALEAAGEKGPFLLVGHSFGGLLAANIARRRPDIVAGLVLLDATPPDTILYGPPQRGLRMMRWQAFGRGVLRLFGLGSDRERQQMAAHPVYGRLLRLIDEQLGEAGAALRAVESTSAAACFANASIFRELTPTGLAEAAWETVTYDGDLGDLPVWLVAPRDTDEVKAVLPEAATASPEEARRIMRVLERTRERYLAVSARSRRVVAPAGTGHNFPYEAPVCVVEVVREALG